MGEEFFAASAYLSKEPELIAGITAQDIIKVILVGFGTFSTSERGARKGRNPQTGAPIQIAAARVPSFKAGKALKDSVNS
ncbi:MAG: HU family DNA-binding protein [Chitinophagia bacterium]|nr:HU family DNA-binding protein [Chitinophagia bacterium]